MMPIQGDRPPSPPSLQRASRPLSRRSPARSEAGGQDDLGPSLPRGQRAYMGSILTDSRQASSPRCHPLTPLTLPAPAPAGFLAATSGRWLRSPFRGGSFPFRCGRRRPVWGAVFHGGEEAGASGWVDSAKSSGRGISMHAEPDGTAQPSRYRRQRKRPVARYAGPSPRPAIGAPRASFRRPCRFPPASGSPALPIRGGTR